MNEYTTVYDNICVAAQSSQHALLRFPLNLFASIFLPWSYALNIFANRFGVRKIYSTYMCSANGPYFLSLCDLRVSRLRLFLSLPLTYSTLYRSYRRSSFQTISFFHHSYRLIRCACASPRVITNCRPRHA